MLPSYCRGVLIALRVNAECNFFVPNARKPALGKLHMSRLMRILLLHFSFVDVPLCFGMLGALLAVGARFRLLLWALKCLLLYFCAAGGQYRTTESGTDIVCIGL